MGFGSELKSPPSDLSAQFQYVLQAWKCWNFSTKITEVILQIKRKGDFSLGFISRSIQTCEK